MYRDIVRRDHQLKRRAAQRKLNAIASWEVKESQGNGSKPEAPSREELLHLQIFKNMSKSFLCVPEKLGDLTWSILCVPGNIQTPPA